MGGCTVVKNTPPSRVLATRRAPRKSVSSSRRCPRISGRRFATVQNRLDEANLQVNLKPDATRVRQKKGCPNLAH